MFWFVYKSDLFLFIKIKIGKKLLGINEEICDIINIL